MAGTDDWMAVAREATADDLRERILTGFKAGKPFTPYRPTLPLPAVRTVLDFGCGLGRNFPYLKEVASHVTGFDLPPMVERCRELAPAPADALSSTWEELSKRPYDLIFTTLVLQHVEPDACRQYLADFARMAPAVYLLTRASSDFGTNVLQHCADSGLFDAGECVEVEHDEATHQLRVVGSLTLDQVLRTERDGHYEVILRARRSAAPTLA
jgi:SAM-dependent methyltransferase